ncbi:MAG: AAA family ATPase [bacterium]
MQYLKKLGLIKEPFSSSPDPDFFYQSSKHNSVLNRLLLEIENRQGLCVVLGNIGTGKTTLSRKLFQRLSSDQTLISHMILDPAYESERVFLEHLVRIFKIDMSYYKESSCSSNLLFDYKDAIKNYLFEEVFENEKNVVLIIDEAQKMPQHTLEILRTFLNYESNQYKLLQLILLGQMEFLQTLKKMENFTDRITYRDTIDPLNRIETEEMIKFRFRRASLRDDLHDLFFTNEAIDDIYHYSKGHPRKINNICHESLLLMLVHEREKVDRELTDEAIANLKVWGKNNEYQEIL